MLSFPYTLLGKDDDSERALCLLVLTPEAVAAAADVVAAFLADVVDMECVLDGDAVYRREGLESELRLEKAKDTAAAGDALSSSSSLLLLF